MIEQSAIIAGFYFLIFRKLHGTNLIRYAAPFFRWLEGKAIEQPAAYILGSIAYIYDAWRSCSFCFALIPALVWSQSVDALGIAFGVLILVALYDALSAVVLIAYSGDWSGNADTQ